MPLSESSPTPKPHLWRMDVLRGVAILMVFLYHCECAAFIKHPVYMGAVGFSSSAREVIFQVICRFGWLGVDLFFVISGFLIHLSYLREACDPRDSARCAGPLKTGAYLSRRFWRIYPPYLGALLVAMLMQTDLLHGHVYPFWTFLHLTLTQNLQPGALNYVNLVFWSLCVEAQIYLFYPILLKIRRRVYLMLIVLAAAAVNYFTVVEVSHCWSAGNMPMVQFWSMLPTTQFITWLAGFCLAESYFYGSAQARAGGRAGNACLVAAAVLGGVYVAMSPELTRFQRPALALCFFIVIGGYIRINRPLALGERVLQFFGESSYSFYLLHALVLYRLWLYLEPRVASLGEVTRFAVCTAVAGAVILPLAWLYYQVAEKGSIALGRRLRSRRREAAGPVRVAPAA